MALQIIANLQTHYAVAFYIFLDFMVVLISPVCWVQMRPIKSQRFLCSWVNEIVTLYLHFKIVKYPICQLHVQHLLRRPRRRVGTHRQRASAITDVITHHANPGVVRPNPCDGTYF